jgi:hypothetical protein
MLPEPLPMTTEVPAMTLNDAEKLRRIARWADGCARAVEPVAGAPAPGGVRRVRIGSGDLDVLLDGLRLVAPELRALAARLDAARAGGRPRLRAVATTEV